jgi:Leucine-rich repeat (LRR) protein
MNLAYSHELGRRTDDFSVGLAGAIPASIGNLTFLSSLQLPDNALTGAIPPSIGGIQRLRLLDLSGNQLGGVIPHEAALLTNMTHLDLSRNLLVGPIPPELGTLGGALVNLSLSKNHLTGNEKLHPI